MTFRMLSRACRGRYTAGLLLALLAQAHVPAASAAPPGFTGAPIVADPTGTYFFINLREQGVISGSGPLNVAPVRGSLMVNGAPSTVIGIQAFPGESRSVCLTLEDEGFNRLIHTSASIDLTVTNLRGQTATQTVIISLQPGPSHDPVDSPREAVEACFDPNTPPTANAGADRTVADTDGQPGENVVLNGSASADADAGTVLTYQWFRGETPLAAASTSPTLTTNLPSGTHDIQLLVTDDSGETETSTAADSVQIIVNGPQVPIVNAGIDQVVTDTDREPGEVITLAGTASDPDGTIASFQWFSGETSLGTGPTIQTRLPDGVNVVTLIVVDSAGISISDTIQITVGVPAARVVLAELPSLTQKQQRTAVALDRICRQLDNREGLTGDQQDLRRRCDGIYFGNTVDRQIQALDELVTEDFAVARTQTLLFANTQYAGIMDRLMALRGGARGLSLAGLNIIVDGKMVPLAQMQEMAKQLFGGGASADAGEGSSAADQAGGLLSDKWGLWARGNFSFGEKDSSPSSPSFDADQWSLLGGVDYRLSDRAVVGLSLAYGDSSVEFNPSNEGALDTTSWAASLYGSMYAAKNFYFDAILNVANSSYEAQRNITYVDGTGLVNEDASGDTDGLTLSGGVSAGYDFPLGGLTLSPNLGFFYIDTKIDSFTEQGAGGLNLIYDEQQFESLTGNLGLRATYAWSLGWGVLLPHLRVDYVREFEDDVDVFGVRFAADPNANSAPPILVETDNPDRSYWRFAAGFSAQFKYGLSGYVEYQRLESFEFISFQDVSIGLRMQRSF